MPMGHKKYLGLVSLGFYPAAPAQNGVTHHPMAAVPLLLCTQTDTAAGHLPGMRTEVLSCSTGH